METRNKGSKTKSRRTTPKRATTPKSRRTAKRGSTSKRQLIDTGTDKRYVRRNKKGQFKESDDVSRSLAADRRKKAKTKAKAGQGDRGDR